jgi:hypothetical protein
MRAVCLWICGVVMVASALVSACHVDPLTAAVNAKARPDIGVSQIITRNFDELGSASGGYVELFAGFHGVGGGYCLSIYEHPDGGACSSGGPSHPGASEPAGGIRIQARSDAVA